MLTSEAEMSDGPHRSLPLDRRWRRFTECAGNPNFTEGQVQEALMIALEADARRTLPKSLLKSLATLLADPQLSLDRNADIARLQQLRLQARSDIARDLVDYVALDTRSSQQRDLSYTIRRVLLDLGARRLRQIEEHCLRHSSPQAELVPTRAAEALRTASLTDPIHRLLDADRVPAPTSLPLRTELDDGIPLRDTSP